MDQIKIGQFLRELRNKKGVTQEQLAERFGVARRTVSRWETGSNLPSLDLLVALSDFYGIDLRELLDGAWNSEKSSRDLEETMVKAAEYSSAEKERITRRMRLYYCLGLIGLVVNAAISDLAKLDGGFWDFLRGCMFGLALVGMVLGMLHTTGILAEFPRVKNSEVLTRKGKQAANGFFAAGSLLYVSVGVVNRFICKLPDGIVIAVCGVGIVCFLIGFLKTRKMR